MIKEIIKMLIYPEKYSSDAFVRNLRKKGCKIGKGTKIWAPNKTFIDCSRPFLLVIGEYCKITRGVTILTHDYSRSVVRRVYGEILGEAQLTVIGNNCFIGNNAILLMGVEIGENCIIAAGSVVTKSFPKNVVIGGNPARVICTIHEYYEKRKIKYIDEAKWYAKQIYKNTGRMPTIKEMEVFFPIFMKRDKELLIKNNIRYKLGADDENDIIEKFYQSEPIYNSFEEFLNDCRLNN